jgi:hypothetical protein
LGYRSGAPSQRIRLGHVRRDDLGSPRGVSWSSVKLGGSSSERVQIVIGIPLLAGGDRTMLTTFLVDVPISRKWLAWTLGIFALGRGLETVEVLVTLDSALVGTDDGTVNGR